MGDTRLTGFHQDVMSSLLFVVDPHLSACLSEARVSSRWGEKVQKASLQAGERSAGVMGSSISPAQYLRSSDVLRSHSEILGEHRTALPLQSVKLDKGKQAVLPKKCLERLPHVY